MKGFKLGVLMLAVLAIVTFGGYAAQGAMASTTDSYITQRINEILAQIKWLQEELVRLQNQVNPDPTTRTVDVGTEFQLNQNEEVLVRNVTPAVTLKNISQIYCVTTPCGPAYNILVKEQGKADKNITVGYSKVKITDTLEMAFVGSYYQYGTGSGTSLRFKLTSVVTPPPSQNFPPVITGLSGPTTLKVSETGTFTVSAYDPENKTLSYLIKWGDEPLNYQAGYSDNLSIARPSQQTTFTHSYANPGDYTIRLEVSDDVGNIARSSLTVRVSNQGAIKVVHPNGGEVFYYGSNSTINWEMANEPVSVSLERQFYCPPGAYCAMMMPADLVLSNYVSKETNWLSVRFGDNYYNYDYYYGYPTYNYSTIPEGTYKAKVCGLETGKCDTSDNYFSVIRGATY